MKSDTRFLVWVPAEQERSSRLAGVRAERTDAKRILSGATLR